MKNFLIFSGIFLCTISSIIAQDNSSSFYATMSLNDAKKLQKEYPQEIYIIDKKRNEAAVLLTEEGAHLLHEQILTHGPGYIYQPTRDESLKALALVTEKKKADIADYTITEDATVNQVLDLIKVDNIANHIQELENYGTRYDTTKVALQCAKDLKLKWESLASNYNRTDVSVRLVNHDNTQSPSVIMTIKGKEFPDQYVIVGGHLDSTSRNGYQNAPGADDDASGIATITEATRALFEAGFQPARTIEVMAYAAEERGLRGSREIAKSYRDANKNVIAVSQFDMTNYNGSANDIYFIEDRTDETLNAFMMSLIDHYNGKGTHQITYSTSRCNYGCSDHDSWDNQGYRASFPFEANIATREHNQNIHTKDDTFELIGTADHAAKFTKLCAEFLIETAKSQSSTLAVDDLTKDSYKVYVQNDNIMYSLPKNGAGVKMIQIFDVNGRSIFQKANPEIEGSIPVGGKSSGVYVISFQLNKEQQFSKKIILE